MWLDVEVIAIVGRRPTRWKGCVALPLAVCFERLTNTPVVETVGRVSSCHLVQWLAHLSTTLLVGTWPQKRWSPFSKTSRSTLGLAHGNKAWSWSAIFFSSFEVTSSWSCTSILLQAHAFMTWSFIYCRTVLYFSTFTKTFETTVCA